MHDGIATCLEAFAVHDACAVLVKLGLGHQHARECRERRQHGTADPGAVSPLGRSDHVHGHIRRHHLRDA